MTISVQISAVGLDYDFKVPSLNFIFRISPGGTNIKILRFVYTLWFSTGERFILGYGKETPRTGGGQSIWQSQDTTVTSTFELGHEKASLIDRALSKMSRDNDLMLELSIACDYVEQIKAVEGADYVKFQSHTQSLYHPVPRSHWDKWLTHWGKLQTVIVVSGAVARKLDELRVQTGNLGYEELVGLLLDNFVPTPAALESTFVSTLPTNKEIKTKLEDMLARGADSREVSLTGWIDGSITTHLQGLLSQGVTVRLLTRSSTEKGVTSALQHLQKVGAQVRKNDMVHARIVIVGEREVLVSSADPKASSLVDNREAGIYSTNPVVVRAARSFFEEVWAEVEGHQMSSLKVKTQPQKMPTP
jgi:hypothetical protein